MKKKKPAANPKNPKIKTKTATNLKTLKTPLKLYGHTLAPLPPFKRLKAHLGEFMLCYFDDHCLSDDGRNGIPCLAVGQLFRITDRCIVLRFWAAPDAPGNDEFTTLVKSAIRGVKFLK